MYGILQTVHFRKDIQLFIKRLKSIHVLAVPDLHKFFVDFIHILQLGNKIKVLDIVQNIRCEVVADFVQFLRVGDLLADCGHFLIQPKSCLGAVCQPFL